MNSLFVVCHFLRPAVESHAPTSWSTSPEFCATYTYNDLQHIVQSVILVWFVHTRSFAGSAHLRHLACSAHTYPNLGSNVFVCALQHVHLALLILPLSGQYTYFRTVQSIVRSHVLCPRRGPPICAQLL
jgi:hypothetical protein